MDKNNYEYAGFWVRVAASLIDSVLIIMVTFPVLYAIYGSAYIDGSMSELNPVKMFVEWILPVIATVIFWVHKSATPGKMIFSLKVLDERTGMALTSGQSLVRYLGYFASMIPFFAGIFWVGVDRKKRGFHDMIAGTVVVRDKSVQTEDVRFGG